MESITKRAAVVFFAAALLVGCGVSTEQIGETTKASIQQTFDTDAQIKTFHLTVTNVQVLKQGDNRYQGIAKVVHDGTSYDVPVEITADGSNVKWKAEPGAFVSFPVK